MFIEFAIPTFTFSSFKFNGTLTTNIKTEQGHVSDAYIRFNYLDLQHIDAEICEDKPKNLLRNYFEFKDIMKLRLFCPLYSLSDVEKSRLQQVQLTYVENYMIEKGDFLSKCIDFLNLL